MAEHVEALIVGAGAAGSIMAAKLAQAGRQVLVLDGGPAWREEDLISSQIWARRIKWRGAPVIKDGSEPIDYNFNAGSGFGGSALHHFAVWPRLHEEDFAMRSRYGRGRDWPISYDDLRPWYDRVQTEVGIAGDAQAEVWRPAGDPYPMGPVPVFAQGEAIKRGFDQLGMTTAPLPLALNSREYKGRPACIWDGWCDAGCPIGALANPLAIYLPIARENGAELRAHASVIRLRTGADGSRVTGADYIDAEGRTRTVEADVVVLAAFAVENVRILLNSAEAGPAGGDGLANSSGLLGSYVMTHPAGLVYGLFDEETQPYMGATGGQLVNQDNYAKDRHDRGFGSYQWMIAQAMKPNDLLGIATTKAEYFGRRLHDFMQRAAHGFAGMTAVVEDLPVRRNRITLSDKKDANGTPLAHVTHNAHPDTVALWNQAKEMGQRIFVAAGAREIWTGPYGKMHLMGGTVMGANPKLSVTNSYGRAHDLENLYIAGPGLMPTSGGVNPTFTVHALAARSADHLIANWPG